MRYVEKKKWVMLSYEIIAQDAGVACSLFVRTKMFKVRFQLVAQT